MTGHAATGRYRERNSTADRALDILGLFDTSRLSIGAVEVADHLGVARSTAYRYVQSLVQSGFLEEGEVGRFRLGRRVLELAMLARRGLDLSGVARPVLRRLAADVGETALLTRLTGSTVFCLEREEAPTQRVRISYERGQTLPLNAGASAFVLLAWLGDSTLGRVLDGATFPAFTPATLTTQAALRKRLADTVRQGYGISRGELDTDVLGIAAPVRDSEGVVVAAVSIAAVASRVDEHRLDTVIEQVQAAAADVSAAYQLVR